MPELWLLHGANRRRKQRGDQLSKTAFLFPGQGAQSVGMGRQLVETSPVARQLFDRAREILGYDLADLCLRGPAEKLDSTVYSQPALFVTSLAALENLRIQSPKLIVDCGAAAGLSLGEYSALVFADVMDFEAALNVVKKRGEAMQEAADAIPSGMVSILGLERAQVEQICAEVRTDGELFEIANYLCPGNIVCSGHKAACQRAVDVATRVGAMKVIPLSVAGAFHTQLMATAVARLRDALAHVTLRNPRIRVISNVDASSHDNPEEIRRLLIEQVVSPVRWDESIKVLMEDGYSSFVEVGPGRVLRGLLKRIDRGLSCEGVAC